MTVQAAVEKHFFEIFECIQNREGHTKLPLVEFWNDIDDIKQQIIVNNFIFTFKQGKNVVHIIGKGGYSTDVFMEKLN